MILTTYTHLLLAHKCEFFELDGVANGGFDEAVEGTFEEVEKRTSDGVANETTNVASDNLAKVTREEAMNRASIDKIQYEATNKVANGKSDEVTKRKSDEVADELAETVAGDGIRKGKQNIFLIYHSIHIFDFFSVHLFIVVVDFCFKILENCGSSFHIHLLPGYFHASK